MIKKAINIKPDYARAYSDLGNIYLHQTNLSKALLYYRKAILIDPNLAEAHNNLGNVYKEQGYLQLAADSYRRAVEINSDYTDAHSNLLLVMNYSSSVVGINSGDIYKESLKWKKL